jgi:hypothetical protein
MAEEGADALIEFGADDVLETAGLLMSFRVADGKGVGEKTLGEAMTADNVTSAPCAGIRQADFAVVLLNETKV